MEDFARIVLAMEQHDVAEEGHALPRSERPCAGGGDRVGRSAVAGGGAAARPDVSSDNRRCQRRPGPASFLAVDTRESVGALRAAIRAGADGFFVWPADRDALSIAAAAAGGPSLWIGGPRDRRARRTRRSRATFVATHLARAFARRDKAAPS